MTTRQHQVFLSFHYERDACRAAQIRKYGISRVTCNELETSKMNTDAAITRWIDNQMDTASCTVVLIGSETASRDWINCEIEKSWNDGKGLLGIYIHQIPDQDGQQSARGANPFDQITVGQRKLSQVAKVYDPKYAAGRQVCHYIKGNIAQWVEDAILIRTQHRG